MNPVYLDTARLLTQIARLVFSDGAFALKGGRFKPRAVAEGQHQEICPAGRHARPTVGVDRYMLA